MDIPLTMNQQDLFKTRLEVESYNKALQKGAAKTPGALGKDDFLKLLIVQLQNQDPTKPLEDKEFIAQMAQFSSLEQMVEMNKTLGNLITDNKSGVAYSLLGRHVEVFDEATGGSVSGVVDEVSVGGGSRGNTPSISFDGLSYSVDQVVRVRDKNKE
jgi:flagellar basal-body rod modification protein FlgD